jgi:hypothetical protein
MTKRNKKSIKRNNKSIKRKNKSIKRNNKSIKRKKIQTGGTRSQDVVDEEDKAFWEACAARDKYDKEEKALIVEENKRLVEEHQRMRAENKRLVEGHQRMRAENKRLDLLRGEYGQSITPHFPKAPSRPSTSNNRPRSRSVQGLSALARKAIGNSIIKADKIRINNSGGMGGYKSKRKGKKMKPKGKKTY